MSQLGAEIWISPVVPWPLPGDETFTGSGSSQRGWNPFEFKARGPAWESSAPQQLPQPRDIWPQKAICHLAWDLTPSHPISSIPEVLGTDPLGPATYNTVSTELFPQPTTARTYTHLAFAGTHANHSHVWAVFFLLKKSQVTVPSVPCVSQHLVQEPELPTCKKGTSDPDLWLSVGIYSKTSSFTFLSTFCPLHRSRDTEPRGK